MDVSKKTPICSKKKLIAEIQLNPRKNPSFFKKEISRNIIRILVVSLLFTNLNSLGLLVLRNAVKLFKPILTPYKIFKNGAFGGTYWRPILHKGKLLKDRHRKFHWNLPDNIMTRPMNQYDPEINKFKVKCGMS